MKKIGFRQSKSDPCLFVRQNEKGLAMVAIYIDDGYACGDKAALDQMIQELEAAKLKLKVGALNGRLLELPGPFQQGWFQGLARTASHDQEYCQDLRG